MSDERWYFSKEQLENSPSRRCGIDADKELMNRQQAANFIRDVGKRLSLTQLCISTAIVYMHRFYMFHSFTHFHRNTIAMAALFLAAKVEEQPRKLEYIIKMAEWCLQKGQTKTDCNSESYIEQAQELVMNENILLQTLGFDMAVEHPHTYIVQFCELASLSKDISHASYFWASNSLYLTTMCLQYRPTVVACFCIHLVCRWSNCEIPKSKENLSWWSYIDESVTQELLEQMTNEFLVIYDKCPSRLKKIIQNSQKSLTSQNSSLGSLSFDGDRRQNSNGQSSGSSGSHGMASTSSMSQHQKQQQQQHQQQQQQQSSIDNKITPGPSRVQKSSAAISSSSSSSNHHQSFHMSAAKTGSAAMNASTLSSSSVNGSNNQLPNAMTSSQLNRSSSSSSHLSSSQQQRQQLQQQQQQQQQMSSGSHHAPNKSVSSSAMYNVAKSKMNPASVSHSASTAANIGGPPLKDMGRLDQRKAAEVKQEPALSTKHDNMYQTTKPEPAYNATAAAVASISNYQHPTTGVSAAAKNTYKKDTNLLQESNRVPVNSHSEIISNVIKEVTLGKQNEKRNVVKTEPSENNPDASFSTSLDSVDNAINSVVAAAKTSKNHSIFSPSPVGRDSVTPSPIEERTLPAEVQIKPEPSTVTPTKATNRQYRPGIPDSELIPVVKKLETVAGYEDVFKKNSVLVPPATSIANAPASVNNHKKNNGVSAALPSHHGAAVKEEPGQVKSEPGEYSKSTTAISQLLVPNISDAQQATRGDKIEVAAGECSTATHHKKKKKHKEKDKRHDKEKKHKEKKRHKDDKHRHCKEHSKEKELKEPGPIKITIPKEKLVDIPMKLKIKINKDQIMQPSAAPEESSTSNDFKLKISKDMLKSRKRERESDHEHSSKKFAHNNATNSHNGYKDYL